MQTSFRNGSTPTVLLLHDAFADASGWAGVIALLREDGIGVMAPAVPLRGLLGDAVYVASVAGQFDGPVLLVGHGYGGAVATVAGTQAGNVVGLVHVAGFALAPGESTLDAAAGFAETECAAALRPARFRTAGGASGIDLYLKADRFHAVFAADLPERIAEDLAAAQRPVAAAAIAVIALVVLTAPAQPASAARHSSDKPKPTIVLVHGAWADASGWGAVIERLQRAGYRVIAPANPLRSLAGDSAYLASVIEQESGPLVLVGHSYGGAVISNAADGNPNVKALVYIAGFVPAIGEDTLHLAGEGSLVPESIEFKGFPPFGPTDVDVYIDPDKFRATFAADVSERKTAVMAASQRPVALAAAGGPSMVEAWRDIPSWYLLARDDRTITPASQRFMADRAGATTVEVDSSHVAMISAPRATVKLIEQAVRATD